MNRKRMQKKENINLKDSSKFHASLSLSLSIYLSIYLTNENTIMSFFGLFCTLKDQKTKSRGASSFFLSLFCLSPFFLSLFSLSLSLFFSLPLF